MSSGALDPLSFPQQWDVVVVAGNVSSPGLAKVSEFKRKHEFDVKKGKGTLGATVTFVGRPPATGSVKFYLWTPTHFQQWDIFRTYLKYDPTKKAVQAIDIYHPSLADIEVSSVVVESIGNFVHEGQQYYSITVELLEYFPPPKKSAVSTPTGSNNTNASTTPGTPPLDAPDAYQMQIAALLKQAQSP